MVSCNLSLFIQDCKSEIKTENFPKLVILLNENSRYGRPIDDKYKAEMRILLCSDSLMSKFCRAVNVKIVNDNNVDGVENKSVKEEIESLNKPVEVTEVEVELPTSDELNKIDSLQVGIEASIDGANMNTDSLFDESSKTVSSHQVEMEASIAVKNLATPASSSPESELKVINEKDSLYYKFCDLFKSSKLDREKMKSLWKEFVQLIKKGHCYEAMKKIGELIWETSSAICSSFAYSISSFFAWLNSFIFRDDHNETRKSKDLYCVLELENNYNATQEEIKSKFHYLRKLYHPDKHSPELRKLMEEAFVNVCEAYDVLSCPKEKLKYDISIGNIPFSKKIECFFINLKDLIDSLLRLLKLNRFKKEYDASGSKEKADDDDFGFMMTEVI